MEKIICGDAIEVLKTLESESVDCVISSPPYWGLRDYGVKEQLGLEPDFEDYIKRLVAIFSEAKRVLKKEGTCWVNMGDTYSAGDVEGFVDATDSDRKYSNAVGRKKGGGSRMPSKCLMQIPYRFSIAMVDAGWILRNIIVWHKPNAMPTSVIDRFTCDWEPVFFFSKSKRYYFEQQLEKYTAPMNRWGGDKLKADGESMWDNGTGQESYRDRNMRPNPDGRNTRTVWSINTKPYAEAHFATFPEKLIEPMVMAGCPQNGIILDPFSGAATTGLVAKKLGRNYIGIELNPAYVTLSERRLNSIPSSLFAPTK